MRGVWGGEVHGHELLSIEGEDKSAIKSRPVFERVKRKILEDKADGLIAYRLDRVGRSVKDLALIADEFQRAGKALIFVQNAIDTSTPKGNSFSTSLPPSPSTRGRCFWSGQRRGGSSRKSRARSATVPARRSTRGF